MCTYLAKRGSTYYFRRVIPKELRPHIGKVEWMRSLNTKDRTEAKKLIPAHALETDRTMEAAQSAVSSQVSEGIYHRAPRPAPYGPSEDEIAYREYETAREIAKLQRREDAEETIEWLQARLGGSTEAMPKHMRAFKYILEGHEFQREILRDQLLITKAALSEANQKAARPEVADSSVSVSLRETFNAYAKDQSLKPDTVIEWRAVIDKLVTFVGHDDAARLTADDVHRWKDVLLAENGKLGRLRSPKTVKGRYIAAIRAMLKWAVEQRRLSG